MKINPNTFNSHFWNTADNIIQKISAQITSNTDNNSNYKYYLNLTAKGPLSNIKFNKITTKEIEKVISLLRSKNSSGYDEISMKTLKIRARSSPPLYAIDLMRQFYLVIFLYIWNTRL
jgi:hypothetical protein